MHRFNTLFVGKVLQRHPQLASTNTYALSLLSNTKPPEGTVISAIRQHEGRGQIGSKWESEAGKNITLSIILYPGFLPARHQFQLNQAVSLAVYDFVEMHIGEGVSIKWPNDIYVAKNKIAGILIQNTVSGENLSASVVGIGLNVNQVKFLTSPPNPTSLILETGKEYDVEELIQELCFLVEKRYLVLKSGAVTRLKKDYHNHLYRYKIESEFRRKDGSKFKGTIIGVDETGRLKIEIGGAEALFDLKEIGFI